MLVFEKERLVFLALPKTGTTALETALEPMAAVVMRNPPNLKHTPGYRYERYLKTYLEKCGLKKLETVCVVRHPIDWLASWYRYRARPAKDGTPTSTKNITFDTFVVEYASDRPAEWARIGSPPRFIRDNAGEVTINHLFQYEQMDLLVAFMERRLGKTIDVPRRNVSPARETDLSSATRTLLERKHAQMFEDWANARREL